jgi:hypothetical protein
MEYVHCIEGVEPDTAVIRAICQLMLEEDWPKLYITLSDSPKARALFVPVVVLDDFNTHVADD